MAAILMQLEGVARHIGDRVLFEDASLHVRPGDRIGLVGPNGAGKTTLLKLLSGDETCDAGRVSVPRDVRVGMLRQEIDPRQSHSVREEAGTAFAELDRLERELASLEARMAESGDQIDPELAARYDAQRARFEAGGGFERHARVDRVLAGLGFDDERASRPLASFSGGWLMRVELAKLLLAGPDLLLLDEPTNHLDLPSIAWFEQTLAGFAGAVITVSHDRAFLRRQTRRIAELDGAGRFNVYEAGYDGYLEEREARRAELLAQKKKQDREIVHMEKFVERFRAKATKAKQAQSRVKALDKIERIEIPDAPSRRLRLRIPDPPRSGQVVLRLEDVHKSYGSERVYSGVSLQLQRGERVALVGPNGAGKSTLLRMVAGALEPDSGTRELGHNVQPAFFAQHQLEALDESRSVLDEAAVGAHTDDLSRLRSHLGAFMFSGDDVDKPVSVLSGGEKARLALAKLLLRPANFLILDEPTNHLDITACEVLEEAIAAYPGTVALVSHDRDFLNALATRVLEVKGGGLREFIGNYADYERKLEAEQAAGGAVPGAELSAAPETAGTKGGASQSKAERMAAREQAKQRTRDRTRLTRETTRLEERIAELEAQRDALGLQLGEPEVYRDPDKLREVEAKRSAAQQEIDEASEGWEAALLELEALDDEAPS